MCKHSHSCVENVITSFLSIFRGSLMLKLAVNNLAALFSPAKLVRQLTSWKSNKDCLMFALFASLMNVVYKIVICTLRRINKDDRINAPIAGFLAGLMAILE